MQLPNGNFAQVKHVDVGEVSFSPTFKLTHVYHIPSFKFNLISVPHLTKSPPCVAYSQVQYVTFGTCTGRR